MLVLKAPNKVVNKEVQQSMKHGKRGGGGHIGGVAR